MKGTDLAIPVALALSGCTQAPAPQVTEEPIPTSSGPIYAIQTSTCQIETICELDRGCTASSGTLTVTSTGHRAYQVTARGESHMVRYSDTILIDPNSVRLVADMYLNTAGSVDLAMKAGQNGTVTASLRSLTTPPFRSINATCPA